MRLQAAVGVRGAAEALQLAPRPGPRRQRVLLPQVGQSVGICDQLTIGVTRLTLGVTNSSVTLFSKKPSFFEKIGPRFKREPLKNSLQGDTGCDVVDILFNLVDSRCEQVDTSCEHVDTWCDQGDTRCDQGDTRCDQVIGGVTWLTFYSTRLMQGVTSLTLVVNMLKLGVTLV